MRWFWLYRPTAPTVRAQAIQVIHMAHAMASRGHDVTLCVDPEGSPSPSVAQILAFYGLEPLPQLHLHVLPSSGTLAAVVYRALFTKWVWQGDGTGIAYARSKRHAIQAVRWLGGGFRLVLEVHEVDSRQAQERNESPLSFRILELGALRGALGVVANCPGTLSLLEETIPLKVPAIASQNGTHRSRVRHPSDPGEGAGYVGSLRQSKDVQTLVEASKLAKTPITFVGVEAPDRLRMGRFGGGKLVLEPPLAHKDVPDRLAQFRVLVLPLSPGLFGERLTSPLKLWDYLASGRAIVGADTPALHDAAPGAFLPYQPGDAASLAGAIDRLAGDAELRASLVANARLRTWDDRAAEIEAFVAKLL